MPAEVKKEIELEIAHILFLDIVGYSKLSVNEQHGRVDELNGIVRLSEQFQKAEAANRICTYELCGESASLLICVQDRRVPLRNRFCASDLLRISADEVGAERA